MTSLYINQPAGLGDIIFSMSAVRQQASRYSRVYWPVDPQWVEGLNRAYPDIRFISRAESIINHESRQEQIVRDTPLGDLYIIPLRFSDSLCRVPFKFCMKSKYSYFGLDWKDWQKDGTFEHTEELEIALKGKLRGNALHKQYVLINRIYKSDESGRAHNIPIIDRAIEMRHHEGFSLFDWSKLIMTAKEIHTVGTSLIYLIELLKPTCKVFVYPRQPQHRDHSRYEYILRSCDYVLMK